jgi:hypothetical protein
MSEEARILSMFLQGKGVDEIASSLGLDRDRVENVLNVLLSRRGEDEQAEFRGFEDELMNLYLMQKKRVMRYMNLERNMRIPIPETKDNLIILIKILEVMWRIRGGRVSVDKLKGELFGVGEVED